jgi:hypothetical protein
MVVSGGYLRHVLDHTPLRRQRRVATHRRLIHTDQLAVLRPLGQPRRQLRAKGRLRLGLGLQMAVTQPTQAKAPLVQQLAHPLPAMLPPKAGGDDVPDQLRGPQAHVVARRPRTVADRVFDLRPLRCRESRWAARAGCPFPPVQPGLIERVNPGPSGVLVAVEPLSHLGAAFTIHQQQDSVRTLAQPYIRRTATGRPHVLACHSGIRNRQPLQPSPLLSFPPYTREGLKNRNYFVGSL